MKLYAYIRRLKGIKKIMNKQNQNFLLNKDAIQTEKY